MKRQSPTTHYFLCEDEALPIRIRKHPTSRRIVIRYQPRTHSLALTLPRYASLRQGLSFIEEKRPWVISQLRAQPRPQAFAHGANISILGKSYQIQHEPGRGVARLISSPSRGEDGRGASGYSSVTQCPHPNPPPNGEGIILVPGAPEFLPRRVRDFLKRLAREEITYYAHLHAERIGKKIARISLRDTSSHWGSCNSSGNLSFSWRLIFAPREVLEYVVCHEVAHLKHLNHSKAFWDTVETLFPDHVLARAWLKKHGNSLHGYK